MLERITRRFGWKVLSVVLAFFLWLVVVNYEDPITTRTFKDVEVQKINEANVTSLNQYIEYIEGETVDIVVKGKRSVIDELTETDLNVFADLSKLSITGAIDIEVEVDEAITVVSKKPADMTITTEDIMTVTRNIQYYFNGFPEEGYVALDPRLSPNRIQITGPKSQVEQITSVMVPIAIAGATSDVVIYVAPQLQDENKKEVEKVTSDINMVQIQVPIQLTKTVPLRFKPKDTVGDGYRLTSSTFDLSEVMIRGYANELSNVNEIVIDNITLADKTTDTTVPVNLDRYMPEGINLVEENQPVNLDLVIKPLVDQELIIKTQDISIKNIPEGLKFAYIDDTQEIVITLRGIQEDLNNVTMETLAPSIRLYGAEAGEQTVQIYLSVPTGIALMTEAVEIPIHLQEIETTTEE